jgi:hypothetical protein
MQRTERQTEIVSFKQVVIAIEFIPINLQVPIEPSESSITVKVP